MGFCFSCFPLILVHSSEIFGRGKLRPSLWAVGNSDLEINFSVAGLVSASERVDKKKKNLPPGKQWNKQRPERREDKTLFWLRKQLPGKQLLINDILGQQKGRTKERQLKQALSQSVCHTTSSTTFHSPITELPVSRPALRNDLGIKWVHVSEELGK